MTAPNPFLPYDPAIVQKEVNGTHIALYKHALGPFDPSYSHLRLISVKRPEAAEPEWFRYARPESPANARVAFDEFTGEGEPDGWTYASNGSRIRDHHDVESVSKRWGTEMVVPAAGDDDQTGARGKLRKKKAGEPADVATAFSEVEQPELAADIQDAGAVPDEPVAG